MINITNKQDCCGCNACGDICPREAISFKVDKEGFWYPKVNLEKCINCNLCDKSCPIIQVEKLKNKNFDKPLCYAAIHKNLEIRFDSTSGGLFSILADKMYSDKGYVGGAIYNNNFSVSHFISNEKKDLIALRSSKYLQSDASGFYTNVLELLKKGEKVLACGLPCQIVGLQTFLGKEYDNLITIDLICRYINSPLAYRKYLDSLERQFDSKVTYIKAKNKELGWRQLTHKVVFSNDQTYYGTIRTDKFMKASMMLNCISRPACYACKFKGFPRYADISLGDYWIDQSKSSLDDDTGTSVVLINSTKGNEYFQTIIKKIKFEPVSFESVLAGNPALTHPLPLSSVNRDLFFERIQQEDFGVVVDSMSEKKTHTFRTIIRNVLKAGWLMLKMTRLRPRPLWQFIYLNFIHTGIHSNLKKGYLIYPTPYCLFEIDKRASIELKGLLTFGESVFNHSRLETRISMKQGAKLIIEGSYGFGYGSDIEIFENATLISKGGPRTNMGTTIICQSKIIIGHEVAIGRDVTIRDNNGGHLISINGYRDSLPIIIGEHVWLCSGVTIMSGVKIGDGTIISANTLINSSWPARVVVAGSPARITQRNVYWKM